MFRAFTFFFLFALFPSLSALQIAALKQIHHTVFPRRNNKPEFLFENSTRIPVDAPQSQSREKKRFFFRHGMANAVRMETYAVSESRRQLLAASAGLLAIGAFLLTLHLSVGAAAAIQSIKIISEDMLTNYKAAMVQFPLRTKVATGASLAVLGDAIAQKRESNIYNPRRAVSFAAFDSCYRMFQHIAFPFIVGVCQGRLFGSLLSLIPTIAVSSNLTMFFAALERTLMYQLGVIPLFYYPVFFTFTGFLQGLNLKGTWQRAKANFLPCWKRNLMFWIPIQLVMFGLIDDKWQIPFVCLMGLIWSTILSVTAGKASTKKQPSK